MWSTSFIISVYGPLYICTVIEFVTLSYLMYAMCHRKSPIRQSYFVISILGNIVDFTLKFSACVSYNNEFKMILLWHDYFLFGILGFVLALNRYTAIAYWNEHYRYWSFWPTCAWCIFLLAYPVIVDIGFIAADPNGFDCLPDPWPIGKCGDVFGRMGIRQCISNVITSIGSITVCAMTIAKIRQTSAPQIARKLFIQSCVSNVFFAVLTIVKVYSSVMWMQNDTTTSTQTVRVVENIANYARQCVNIIWLVIIARSLTGTSKHVIVSTTVTSLTTH